MTSSATALRPAKATVATTLRQLGWILPAAVVAATAVDLGIYYAAGILSPDVTAWPAAGPTQIFGANVAYFMIGALTLLALVRFTRRPVRLFVIASAIGLAMSFGAPISAGLGSGSEAAPAASLATVVTLSLLHVGSYAVGVPMLVRAAQTRKPE